MPLTAELTAEAHLTLGRDLVFTYFVLTPIVAYLLKIDRETWDKFKARIQAEGRTVKWVLETLIARYIAHGLDESQKDDKQ